MTEPVYDTTDLMAGWRALDDAREDYLRAWTYYAGTLPEQFASERIRHMVQASADESYRFRFAHKPVTALMNRIKVAAVTGPSSEVTAKLDLIRRANSMDMVEPFVHERALALGDGYLLTWPLPESDDVPADLREAGVEITWQSPLSCRAMYDAEDGIRLSYVIRRWSVSTPVGDQWYAEVWYPDGTIYPWVCQPGSEGTDPHAWQPDLGPDGEGAWPIEHDYGMPIHHARNNLPYGVPEHADAMGPQDALTKLNLTQAVVGIEARTWPERYEIMDPAAENDTARDAVPWGDDLEAPRVSERSATTQRRRSGPGFTHVLSGRKSTGQYDAGNPAEMSPLNDQWVRSMATITGTPLTEYDPERNAGLTGIARMWADKPLRDREDKAKRYLTRFWTEVYGKALEIAGVSVAGELTIVWGRADVIMDPDWWNVATVRRDHGVPQEVILREANYDEDEIRKWLDEDQEARTFLEKVTILEKLGTALQTIGSAVALGVIDSDKVDALVTTIMGTAVIESNPPEPPVQPAPIVPVDDPRMIES